MAGGRFGRGFLGTSLLLAAVLPISGSAQITFERVWGGSGSDIGYCVRQTQDGGYAVLHTTEIRQNG